MTRRLSWWIAVPVALCALLLLAIVAVMMFVNPDRWRGKLQAQVRARTGYELTLAGHLRWKLWPTLRVELGAGSLGAPGAGAQGSASTPWLQWASLQLDARWRPLLHRQLQIERLRVDSLDAHIVIDAQGHGNWELPATGANAAPAAADAASQTAPVAARTATPLLHIGALSLHGARIDFRDARNDSHWQLQSLDLDTGVDADLGHGRWQLAATSLRTVVSAGTRPVQTIAFRADDLMVDVAAATLRLPTWQLTIANASLQGTLTETLQLYPLTGAGHLTASTPSLRALLAALGETLPPTRDAAAFGNAEIDTGWRLDATQLQLQPLQLSLDGASLKGHGDWPLAGVGAEAGAGKAGVAAAGAAGAARPVPTFMLSGDEMRLDRYRTPVGYKGAPFVLPVAMLKDLHVQGELDLNRIELNGVRLRGVRLRLLDKAGALP